MTEPAPTPNADTARTTERTPSETTIGLSLEMPIPKTSKARKAVRPRTPARTTSEHSQSPEARQFSSLKELLLNLPPGDLTGVLRAYPGAVAQGLVKALPMLGGEALKATIIQQNNTTKAVDVEDEIVRLDASWTRWLHEARRQSRVAIRQQRQDARTTLYDLLSGKEDLDQLFEIRLSILNVQGDAAS